MRDEKEETVTLLLKGGHLTVLLFSAVLSDQVTQPYESCVSFLSNSCGT